MSVPQTRIVFRASGTHTIRMNLQSVVPPASHLGGRDAGGESDRLQLVVAECRYRKLLMQNPNQFRALQSLDVGCFVCGRNLVESQGDSQQLVEACYRLVEEMVRTLEVVEGRDGCSKGKQEAVESVDCEVGRPSACVTDHLWADRWAFHTKDPTAPPSFLGEGARVRRVKKVDRGMGGNRTGLEHSCGSRGDQDDERHWDLSHPAPSSDFQAASVQVPDVHYANVAQAEVPRVRADTRTRTVVDWVPVEFQLEHSDNDLPLDDALDARTLGRGPLQSWAVVRMAAWV